MKPRQRQLQFLDHISRHKGLEHFATTGKIEGKRSRGRQRITFTENLKSWAIGKGSNNNFIRGGVPDKFLQFENENVASPGTKIVHNQQPQVCNICRGGIPALGPPHDRPQDPALCANTDKVRMISTTKKLLKKILTQMRLTKFLHAIQSDRHDQPKQENSRPTNNDGTSPPFTALA
ncbi:hypothetical protein PoB_007452000 [Plakobranchus ocellatus]|uniref:Uncharacterized protein n=1 Tax=Plakobranchus ocellatus TaxID=259542 RepID=A0AAV4DVD5_9GAST|nr:hypothetical protein PoB_007452000 [Plakobranchus ocellatus]